MCHGVVTGLGQLLFYLCNNVFFIFLCTNAPHDHIVQSWHSNVSKIAKEEIPEGAKPKQIRTRFRLFCPLPPRKHRVPCQRSHWKLLQNIFSSYDEYI